MQLLASPPRDHLAQRMLRLLFGLMLYGVSDAVLLLAGLGADPWDVFHQGLSRVTGLAIGTWVNIVGALVLVCWWPLRQRPGWGTALNVVTIGTVMNGVLAWTPAPHGVVARVMLVVGSVILNGIATGLYIGAGLGPGPRDGLMTGIARRGHSIRVVRTAIEVAVLVVGFVLGGTVGIGTVVYALGIGPIVHFTIPAFALFHPTADEAR
jgi:uncharacterized membrane protein YczE